MKATMDSFLDNLNNLQNERGNRISLREYRDDERTAAILTVANRLTYLVEVLEEIRDELKKR